MNEVERHVQQTTERLQCIKQSIFTFTQQAPLIKYKNAPQYFLAAWAQAFLLVISRPFSGGLVIKCKNAQKLNKYKNLSTNSLNHLLSASSFQTAVRELLEWCLDDRAFQPHFHSALFSCLMVVSSISSRPGFDLDLGYRLLAVCSAHKDKFSCKSAALLTSWCEELGQLLLHRQQLRLSGGLKSDLTSGVFKDNLYENDDLINESNLPDKSKTPKMLINGNDVTKGVSPGNNWNKMSQMLSPVSSGWDSFSDLPSLTSQHESSMTSEAAINQLNRETSDIQQKQLQHQGFNQNHINSNNGLTNGNAGLNTLNVYPPTPTTPGLSSSQTSSSLDTSSLVDCNLQNNVPSSITSSSQSKNFNHNQWQQSQLQQSQLQTNLPATTAAVSVPTSTPVGRESGTTGCGNMNNNNNTNNVMTSPMARQQSFNMHPDTYNSYPAQGSVAPYGGQLGMNCPTSYRFNSNGMNFNGYNGGMGNGYVGGMGGGAMMGGRGFGDWPPRASSMGGFMGRNHVTPYPIGHQQQQYMRTKRAQCPMGSQPYMACGGGGGYLMGGSSVRFGGSMPHHQGSVYGYGSPASRSRMDPNHYEGSMRPYAPQGGCYNGYAHMTPDVNHGPTFSMFGRPQTGAVPQIPAGNPTPPVTPGSSLSSYLSSPSVDIKSEIRSPNSSLHPAESARMTFPVHDGVLMMPFRLEHNLAVSNHVFHLNETVYQALATRPDLDLQLKCFHHEDRSMMTNWPASVMVSVNATPLNIESQRALHIKDVCMPGRNIVQITVTTCCCSHMFLLHVVHRPTVRSVLVGLMKKRLLPTEQSITKLKQLISSATAVNVQDSTVDSSKQTLNMYLFCPLTSQRIVIPARGQHCLHIQCFDLEAYLHLNSERCVWRCPICKRPAVLEEIEINQYIWGIIQTLHSTNFEEVIIDSTALWKPLPVASSIKEEEFEQWSTSVSVTEMTIPSIDSWLTGQSTTCTTTPALHNPRHEGQLVSGCVPTSLPFDLLGEIPNILTSLAQMGDSLMESFQAPPTTTSVVLHTPPSQYEPPASLSDLHPEALPSAAQQHTLQACNKAEPSLDSSGRPASRNPGHQGLQSPSKRSLSATNHPQMDNNSSFMTNRQCEESRSELNTPPSVRESRLDTGGCVTSDSLCATSSLHLRLDCSEERKDSNDSLHCKDKQSTPSSEGKSSEESGKESTEASDTSDTRNDLMDVTLDFTMLADNMGDPSEFLTYLGPDEQQGGADLTCSDDLIKMFND